MERWVRVDEVRGGEVETAVFDSLDRAAEGSSGIDMGAVEEDVEGSEGK